MAKIHIIGGGISGLAAGVRLAKTGAEVILYEAAGQAGGRCRSYHDAKLDRIVDNGNHILLSANPAALSFVEEIGARDRLMGPERARFAFYDLAQDQAWVLQPGAGAIPWWILQARRRIPGTRVGSYLAGLRLAFAKPDDRVMDCLDPADPLWARFWEPLTVAALNTSPREASARLLWMVLKQSFAKGEAACRPLMARENLDDALIEPALAFLRRQGTEIHLNCRLRQIEFSGERAATLDFGDRKVALAEDDRVISALPPAVASSLLPGVTGPQDSRPIVNAHLRFDRAPALARGMSPDLPFLGLVGGTADWLLLRGDLASLTVSAAEDLAELPNEAIAERLWRDTARALRLDPAERPLIRVIKEKRATFAQTPDALKHRPPARTAWRNLALAGDWCDTGYPATIESAVRAGRAAAEIVAGR